MIQFFNTKAKAFVVFLFSVSALGVFLLSTVTACSIAKDWYGVIAGILLMLIAIPFHCIGKKRQWGYLVSFLLNTVAGGFSVSALYLSKNTPLDMYSMLLSVIPAVSILLLTYLLLQFFHRAKGVTMTIACVLNLILTVLCIVYLARQGGILYSFGFFCSLLSFFYLCVFGVTVNHDERAVLRDISFGSFGAFIIITVVVLFILSEGDILDGLDLPELGGGKAKKKK